MPRSTALICNNYGTLYYSIPADKSYLEQSSYGAGKDENYNRIKLLEIGLLLPDWKANSQLVT